ncbi:MAG: hypothetical protein GEU86_14710 [Actinophytocola sp.]|nr:hypothetical protein [Actinophytocola sp.]
MAWRRSLALFAVCMVAVGVLAFGLIAGVIPVQFGISQNPFHISLERLEGSRITAYVGSEDDVDGGATAMAIAGVEGGEGDALCLSTVLDLPVIGPLSITITSGDSKPILLDKLTAYGTGMEIDSVDVRALELGTDAARLDTNDLLRGPAGSWGMQLDHADVNGIRLEGEQLKVAKLRLRGLGLGEHHCY